jgi:hypothetical protein
MNLNWNRLAALCFRSCVESFGEVYTLTNKNGVEERGMGVFTQLPVEIEQGLGAVVSTSHFSLEIRLCDLAELPKRGDIAGLRGIPFIVLEVKPDGSENCVLLLTQKPTGRTTH